MRGALHDTFTVVTAHTAKCDICNKNNKSEMYRCSKCGRQQCTPCWERNNSDGRHQLHNKDVLKYKGPKAEDLPPKEDPKAVKTGAPPSAQVSGRKRRLNAVTPVTPSSSIGVYAPTASSSPSDIQDYESTKKRVRLVEIEEDTDEDADGEAVTNRTGYPLLAPKDKPDGSVKQQRVPETPANQGSLDNEYPLQSAVDNLIDAAADGSDTGSETDDPSETSQDRHGLNSILQAAGMLERKFTHIHSSPVANHSEASSEVKALPRAQAWTSVNPSSTSPASRLKTSSQSEMDPCVGYASGGNPLAPHSSSGTGHTVKTPGHKDLRRTPDVDQDYVSVRPTKTSKPGKGPSSQGFEAEI